MSTSRPLGPQRGHQAAPAQTCVPGASGFSPPGLRGPELPSLPQRPLGRGSQRSGQTEVTAWFPPTRLSLAPSVVPGPAGRAQRTQGPGPEIAGVHGRWDRHAGSTSGTGSSPSVSSVRISGKQKVALARRTFRDLISPEPTVAAGGARAVLSPVCCVRPAAAPCPREQGLGGPSATFTAPPLLSQEQGRPTAPGQGHHGRTLESMTDTGGWSPLLPLRGSRERNAQVCTESGLPGRGGLWVRFGRRGPGTNLAPGLRASPPAFFCPPAQRARAAGWPPGEDVSSAVSGAEGLALG